MRTLPFVLFLMISPLGKSQDTLRIFFENNSAQIQSEFQDRIIQSLDPLGDIDILEIHGFTDINGSKEHNLSLAGKRVQSAELLLKKLERVGLVNVEEKAHGEVAIPSRDYANDRRVEIVFVEKAQPTIETEKSLSEELEAAEVGKNVTMKNMNFVGGEAILLPKSIPTLHELLQVMRDNPQLKIKIEGHICCSLDDEYDLSTRRAFMVYNHLIDNGIDASRLAYEGFGNTRAIYKFPEQTPEQQSANRRVEILIVSK